MSRRHTHRGHKLTHLYKRLYDGNRVVLEVVKDVHETHSEVLGARLWHVLTEEAHELQRLFVVQDKVRPEGFHLLLLGASVNQFRVVTRLETGGKLFVCERLNHQISLTRWAPKPSKTP